MHCSLIEEKLSVLRFDFINVGHISDTLPAVIDIALALYSLRRVATRSKLLLDDGQHSFFSFVQGLLELLESCHSLIEKVIDQATSECEHSYSKTALNDSLVVPGADCEHLSRGSQRVGDDETDRRRHIHIFCQQRWHKLDVFGLVELTHNRDSLVHPATSCACVPFSCNRQLGESCLV